MKTFKQCADEVAKIHGTIGWASVLHQFRTMSLSWGDFEQLEKEAAELFHSENTIQFPHRTFEECCDQVAKECDMKNFSETPLYDYFKDAANIYAMNVLNSYKNEIK